MSETEVRHDSFGWYDREVAERASRLVLYDALTHEAMGALTTGVFLVGFAVAMRSRDEPIDMPRLSWVATSKSPQRCQSP